VSGDEQEGTSRMRTRKERKKRRIGYADGEVNSVERAIDDQLKNEKVVEAVHPQEPRDRQNTTTDKEKRSLGFRGWDIQDQGQKREWYSELILIWNNRQKSEEPSVEEGKLIVRHRARQKERTPETA